MTNYINIKDFDIDYLNIEEEVFETENYKNFNLYYLNDNSLEFNISSKQIYIINKNLLINNLSNDLKNFLHLLNKYLFINKNLIFEKFNIDLNNNNINFINKFDIYNNILQLFISNNINYYINNNKTILNNNILSLQLQDIINKYENLKLIIKPWKIFFNNNLNQINFKFKLTEIYINDNDIKEIINYNNIIKNFNDINDNDLYFLKLEYNKNIFYSFDDFIINEDEDEIVINKKNDINHNIIKEYYYYFYSKYYYETEEKYIDYIRYRSYFIRKNKNYILNKDLINYENKFKEKIEKIIKNKLNLHKIKDFIFIFKIDKNTKCYLNDNIISYDNLLKLNSLKNFYFKFNFNSFYVNEFITFKINNLYIYTSNYKIFLNLVSNKNNFIN